MRQAARRLAVAQERELVERQGLAYVNIPIEFSRPTEAEFENFSRTLAGFAGKKVLVHCQINLRASTLVFLHRVVVDQVPAAQAYEAVAQIWTPQGPWRELVHTVLRRRGIVFELY